MKPRVILLSLLRSVAVLALIALSGLLLVCGLIVAQAQRNEARRVDAIVVPYGSQPATDHTRHAIELYREGHAARLLLIGDDVAETQAALTGAGLPGPALLTVEQPEDTRARMQAIRDIALENNLESVLLVSEPEQLLLELKMTRDIGLTAYGSPISGQELDTQQVFQASLAYWRYVLLGS